MRGPRDFGAMNKAALCVVAGLLALTAGSALAHDAGPIASATISAAAAQPKTLAPLWVGPAYSGSWYDPSRSGEGFTLQILEDGSALAVWFTYPPVGSAARQAWIIAQGGHIEADRIVFDTVLTTRGPRFGPAYDPARLQIIPWGSLEFRFFDCNSGEFTYAGPPGWGSGTRPLVRLTALSELECSGKRLVGAGGARTLAGLQQRAGAIFDPSHNGEGWMLEELANGQTLVYWFTYDQNGEQAWTIGISNASGPQILIADNLQPVGTHFGADFDAAQVHSDHWGSLEIDFDGCDRGVATYQSSLAAFGSGSLQPVRLSKLAGSACIEGTPAVPSGAWSTSARMPTPQSETAIAVFGNRAWIAGGFSMPFAFQSYDLDADTWSVRANLPGGRDHALGLSFGGNVYLAGGYRTTLEGEQNVSGWRYYPAENRWEAVPQLPDVAASGATMLNGYAHFGSAGGALFQMDPRTLATRLIPRDASAPRDHSQLVAFQGELWMIGGRDFLTAIEHPRVSIFDPASETWRPGPSLQNSRAGFAAAASSALLMVAGGERLVGQRGVLNSAEAIVPGAQQWTSMPAMPAAVHGVGGVLYKNAFYAIGGSLLAGGVLNQGDVQVFRWGP
jgi:hypothetical protein